MRCYINLFDGVGNKLSSIDCFDPIHGLNQLARLVSQKQVFEFASAGCFLWEMDKLPMRQWFIEID